MQTHLQASFELHDIKDHSFVWGRSKNALMHKKSTLLAKGKRAWTSLIYCPIIISIRCLILLPFRETLQEILNHYYNSREGSKPLLCFFTLLFCPSISSSSTNLFQNQCRFHTCSVISSIGTFFVSGNKNNTNTDIIKTQLEKNKNIPNFKWQSIERKAWAITNVNSKFTQTVTLWPAERVSNGNVSLGINHPSGPHDHANEETKVQTMTTTNVAKLLVKLSEWSLTLIPRTMAIINWEMNICTPASSNNIRRPTLSTE